MVVSCLFSIRLEVAQMPSKKDRWEQLQGKHLQTAHDLTSFTSIVCCEQEWICSSQQHTVAECSVEEHLHRQLEELKMVPV